MKRIEKIEDQIQMIIEELVKLEFLFNQLNTGDMTNENKDEMWIEFKIKNTGIVGFAETLTSKAQMLKEYFDDRLLKEGVKK